MCGQWVCSSYHGEGVCDIQQCCFNTLDAY
jgi:hypothetical protein